MQTLRSTVGQGQRSNPCCGSRSGCFLASWIRIRYSEVLIRILLSSSKTVRKTLIPTDLWLLFIFDAWCKCTFKKQEAKKWFFGGVFKVNDKNSRILSRRIHWSEARIRLSGSVPKCHGSATLEETDFSALLESQGRGERRGSFRKDMTPISEMSWKISYLLPDPPKQKIFFLS